MSEIPSRLRLLADAFDAVYQDQGTTDEVQLDLRKYASRFEEQQAEIKRLRRELRDVRQQYEEAEAERVRLWNVLSEMA